MCLLSSNDIPTICVFVYSAEDVSYIVGFERTSYNVSETVGFFGVSVTVTGRSTIPIIVDVSSVDGTATGMK